uniref:Uncharacterized protein n=1 Tax=Tanacetum cinerariifolium TaxID=118510 RepID=A0A6L2LX82_TANCI|nr:hypothetical protein [Tanacetum cinerariifolium]
MPLVKDSKAVDVDVHLYRSMIGSLMYLTASRPEVMYAVCACSRFQVTPKTSHLHAVKRIFRYLKGQPKLGLWYPRESAFELEAYSDSDYVGANLDRKSTTGGWSYTDKVKVINVEAEGISTASKTLNAATLKVSIFWNTIAIKQVNDVTRLQALVDKKEVVVTEAVIREVLRLDDAEGVDCLPNEEIFAELVRMGYEKPSSKLTFYKAFFSSQWKFLIHTSAVNDLVTNIDNTSKFYMYPRFIQLFIKKQVGKGFLGVETPLFEGMLVGQVIEEGGDAEGHVQDVTDDDAAQGNDTVAYGEVPTPQPQPQPQAQQQAADFPLSNLQEALDACAALTRKVEHLEYDKVAQALEIKKLKRRVKKLEKGNMVKVLKLQRLKRVGTSQRIDTSKDTVMDDASNQGRKIDGLDKDDVVALMDDKEEDKKEEEAKVVEDDQVQGRQAESQAEIYKIDMNHALKVLSMQGDKPAEVQVIAATITAAPVKVAAASTRRRKGVVIRDPKEESTTSSIIPADTKSKDKGKRIMVEEPKPLKKKQQQKAKEDPAVQRYQVIKKKPQTEAQARKNMIMYLKNVAGFRLDYFKGMSYNDIPKRRKLNEEVEDLKRHLEIMPEEDDDVYTEATPLARKVPVVDYEIINLNNKPYYKIIRADGTHQLFISFLTLLKNFDREDLEALWNLVKEKYTGSSLEESKEYTWSSKGQELEATGIVCGECNVLRAVKVHKTTASRRPARMMVEYILHQAQEQDLDEAS